MLASYASIIRCWVTIWKGSLGAFTCVDISKWVNEQLFIQGIFKGREYATCILVQDPDHLPTWWVPGSKLLCWDWCMWGGWFVIPRSKAAFITQESSGTANRWMQRLSFCTFGDWWLVMRMECNVNVKSMWVDGRSRVSPTDPLVNRRVQALSLVASLVIGD